MADYDNELDGTRELLEGITIAEETSHHSHSQEPSYPGQSVYTNQVTAFLHWKRSSNSTRSRVLDPKILQYFLPKCKQDGVFLNNVEQPD